MPCAKILTTKLFRQGSHEKIERSSMALFYCSELRQRYRIALVACVDVKRVRRSGSVVPSQGRLDFLSYQVPTCMYSVLMTPVNSTPISVTGTKTCNGRR
jgi:hypothetical protein